MSHLNSLNKLANVLVGTNSKGSSCSEWITSVLSTHLTSTWSCPSSAPALLVASHLTETKLWGPWSPIYNLCPNPDLSDLICSPLCPFYSSHTGLSAAPCIHQTHCYRTFALAFCSVWNSFSQVSLQLPPSLFLKKVFTQISFCQRGFPWLFFWRWQHYSLLFPIPILFLSIALSTIWHVIYFTYLLSFLKRNVGFMQAEIFVTCNSLLYPQGLEYG